MKGLLHHVEIYVSNLKKTKSFWDWFLHDLGYHISNEWAKGISYKLSDTYLVFVQTEADFLPFGYHRKRIGLNHLAFHAESKKMVDEMSQKLISKNVKILYQDKHPYAGGENYYAVFFEDPDRIKVELVAM